MVKVWIAFLLCLIIVQPLKLIIDDIELIAASFVAFDSIMVYIILFCSSYRKPMLLAFTLRLLVMILDVAFSNYLIIPHSGSDSWEFYAQALTVFHNPEILLNAGFNGVTQLYSKIDGILYYMIEPHIMIGEYFNILLGISTIFIVISILEKLEIDNKIIRLTALLMAVFPNTVILSTINLRESFIVFFMVLSIYYLQKWYQDYGTMNMLLSLTFALISSVFHSGMFFLVLCIFIVWAIYDTKIHKIRCKISSGFILIFSVLVVFIIITTFTNIFLDKFASLIASGSFEEENARVSNTVMRAGSLYLSGINVFSSTSVFLMYFPLKIVYFLFSPMPWEWRGVIDAICFAVDSSFYLWSVILVFNNFTILQDNDKNNIMIKFIIVSIFITVVIFALGTSNFGTAMRHREKIMPALVIPIAYLMNKKNYLRRMTHNDKNKGYAKKI